MDFNDRMRLGIDDTMRAAARFYLKNKQGRRFMNKTLPHLNAAVKKREHSEAQGLHVPPFLIASIAAQCNLRCAGCYARAGGACGSTPTIQMDAGKWRRIFSEAADLGVSFILLAGGEPLLRRDVLDAAAEFEQIVFPVFTNGTLIDEEYISFFDTHRNIVPVLSIEGDARETDLRRGGGVAQAIACAMAAFKRRGVLCGVSITVTSRNIDAVTGDAFIANLKREGCGLMFFVEYVPVEAGTEDLMLGGAGREKLEKDVMRLRDVHRDMMLVSFPGDEEALGGCLAAGRGFFHINPAGGAEPCPFSPHWAHTLCDTPMRDVLKSDFFIKMRDIGALAHSGGCALFEHREKVEALMGGGG